MGSYLIFDLGVDWRFGAAHFEELLLDHDPCSNWGNWVAAAGLTGQRVNKFNTRKQLNDYDPKRDYVNHWLKSVSPAPLANSTDSKLEMALDDLVVGGRNSRTSSGGKGSRGKGKASRGYNNGVEDASKRRRWRNRVPDCDGISNS